jgi:RNA polymerase sigma-70 factor (ECF subfamily)
MMSAMAVRMSEGVRTGSRAESDEESVPDDRKLLDALAKGDRSAADALYDTLYPSVARTLQRVLNDPRRDYEDLVQTTFERIMVRLLDGSIAEVLDLRAWASGIATHVALDHLRKKTRERRLAVTERGSAPALLTIAGEASAERQIEARDQLAVIRDVLASMKPDLAEAVLLHDMVGYDLREVAAATETTVAAAQSRLVRGRKELLRRVELRLGKGESR